MFLFVTTVRKQNTTFTIARITVNLLTSLPHRDMAKDVRNLKHTELTVIAVLLVIVLFVSPLTEYWAALDAPWYSPYLVWSVAILISWLLQRFLKKHEV